jgi:hypothetical protein
MCPFSHVVNKTFLIWISYEYCIKISIKHLLEIDISMTAECADNIKRQPSQIASSHLIKPLLCSDKDIDYGKIWIASISM